MRSGQMLSEVLVHLKHADLVFATKDSPELVISEDLALVLGVLQVVLHDVFPHCSHHLGAEQRAITDLSG